MNQYFFVKVKIPAEHLQKGDLPWMPTLIVYKADFDVKGIAVFTSWLKAEEFSAKMSELVSFDREIVEIGDAGMPLTEFLEGVINATRSMTKAMTETPVYVDPPDAHCKDIAVSYNSVQKFMRRALADQIKSMVDHLGFEDYEGFTIALHKRKADSYHGCTAFRGKFDDFEALGSAIEDAVGTTLEKYVITTDYYPLIDTAIMIAKKMIDDSSKPPPKRILA